MSCVARTLIRLLNSDGVYKKSEELHPRFMGTSRFNQDMILRPLIMSQVL